MVGAVRFELTTSCTRNKRASQATLRPEPNRADKVAGHPAKCNDVFEIADQDQCKFVCLTDSHAFPRKLELESYRTVPV